MTAATRWIAELLATTFVLIEDAAANDPSGTRASRRPRGWPPDPSGLDRSLSARGRCRYRRVGSDGLSRPATLAAPALIDDL